MMYITKDTWAVLIGALIAGAALSGADPEYVAMILKELLSFMA